MDINIFIERLDNTTNDTLQTVKLCSKEQLNHKQGDKWSILEILEHLYLTDNIIFTIISRPTIDISPSSEIVGNEKMKTILVDQRDQKLITPEMLKPVGKINNLAVFEQVFLSQRETLKNNISTGKLTIDNRVHKHPILNDMTIIDWLNFTIHHTQRHIEQIKDLLNT
jgi:DinB superfamily